MSATTTSPTSTHTPVLDKMLTEQEDAALIFAAQLLEDSTDYTSGLRYYKIIDELERRHSGTLGELLRIKDWPGGSLIKMFSRHLANRTA